MTIVYFLIAITILVAVHEFGHFYVARRCGVKVLRFSIGFGNRLYSWKDRHGTEFAISSIPLGGYVKMVDEREGEVAEADLPYAFTQKSVWQRIAIAFAGPLANILLAIVLYWAVSLQGSYSLSAVIGEVSSGSVAAEAGLEPGQEIVALDGKPISSRRDMEIYLVSRLGETGEISFTVRYLNDDLVYESRGRITDWLKSDEAPDVIGGLGISFYRPEILLNVAQVQPDSAAAVAGMQVGDKIIRIDGETRETGDQWSSYVGARAGQELNVVVERRNSDDVLDEVTLYITPRDYTDASGNTRGLMGIVWVVDDWPEHMVRHYDYGVLGSVKQAFIQTGEVISTVLVSLKKLIFGEISTKNLSGPIGIAKVVGHSAEAGIWAFVNVLAYISVLLGVFNLLPIPVLDGGHILYALIEWVKGSPVSEKVQTLGYQAGLVMLLGVMVIAFYNDILRL